MQDGNTESLEIARNQYQAGKEAFERGRYRQAVQYLEKAASLVSRNSRLGGEAQIWLVTAYEAAGQLQEAIELCEKLTKHPDRDIRKQGSRLLYILQAPRLRTHPEWLTQIPDLSQLDDPNRTNQLAQTTSTNRSNRPRPKPEFSLDPPDLSQVNTKDNRFIWVALAAIALALGTLFWFT